jgi:hypothetical protein
VSNPLIPSAGARITSVGPVPHPQNQGEQMLVIRYEQAGVKGELRLEQIQAAALLLAVDALLAEFGRSDIAMTLSGTLPALRATPPEGETRDDTSS